MTGFCRGERMAIAAARQTNARTVTLSASAKTFSKRATGWASLTKGRTVPTTPAAASDDDPRRVRVPDEAAGPSLQRPAAEPAAAADEVTA